MAAAVQPPSSSSSSYFSHPRSSRDGFSLGDATSPDYLYSHKRGSSAHAHQPRMPKSNPPTSPPPQPPTYDFQYNHPIHTPSPFKKRDLISRTPIQMSTVHSEWTPSIPVLSPNADGTAYRQVDMFKRPDSALTPENSSEEDREVDPRTPIYLRSERYRQSLDPTGRYTPNSPEGDEDAEDYDADSILGAYDHERKGQRYSTMSDTIIHSPPRLERQGEYEEVFEEEDSQDPSWFYDKGTSIKGRDVTPSKIPIYHASPKPIPMEYIFRSAPLHRSPSTHLQDPQPLEIQNLKRVRSESLLDSFPKQSTTPRTSPSKRKHSTLPRPRSRSLTSMRPSIRSVRTMTPGTTPGKRPPSAKGEPPWIQHSFSPNPSLPPEEQLIPTVAKRLNQERLEREKGLVTVWDREMRPLDGDRRESKVRVHKEADDMPTGNIFVDEAIPEEEKTWPLNQQKRPKPIDPSIYPPAAPVPISPGGPVRVDARALSVTLGPMQRFDAIQDQRQKHKDDDVKRGCCCIIM